MKEQEEQCLEQSEEKEAPLPEMVLRVEKGRIEIPVCLDDELLREIADVLGLAWNEEEKVVKIDPGCIPETLLII